MILKTALLVLMWGALSATTFAGDLIWHPTKAEALAEIAATGKKRIMLLIGNATCHGCENTKYWWAEDSRVKPTLEAHYVLWYHDEGVYPFSEVSDYYAKMPPPSGGSLPHSWVLDASDRNNLFALDVRAGELYPGGIFENFITPWIPTVPTFSEWIGDFGLPAGEEGATNCPAGDGIPNLLKYASGLAPTNPCAPGDLMQGVVSNGTFEMVYFKSKETVDVQLDPIWIASLTNTEWTATGIDTEQLADEAGREKWKATLSSPEEKGFIRLQAVQE